MGAHRVDPRRLQHLVTLYRRGLSARSRRRVLRMGANTERAYVRLLADAGLLDGNRTDVPTLEAITAAVDHARPSRRPAQQVSRAEHYRQRITALRRSGLSLPRIFAGLVAEDPSFDVSYGSVRAVYRSLVVDDEPERHADPAATEEPA